MMRKLTIMSAKSHAVKKARIAMENRERTRSLAAPAAALMES